MKNSIKFHIVGSILNTSVIGVFMSMHSLILAEFDYLFFIRIPVYFNLIYFISVFVISWIAPFMIYKIKNYKKHFVVLLGLYWVLILCLLALEYILNLEYLGAYHGFFWYIKHCITKVLITEQTILISILLSVVIYYCQLLVGSVFMPVLYRSKAKL